MFTGTIRGENKVSDPISIEDNYVVFNTLTTKQNDSSFVDAYSNAFRE